MSQVIGILHWLAGFIVLAEALNKLERVHPAARSITAEKRFYESLKAIAWVLMALCAGGAVASPVLLLLGVHGGTLPLQRLEHPTWAETAGLVGVAILIVRTRIKRG